MKAILIRFITLAVLLTVFSPASRAQWTQTNGPYGGSIRSIAVSGTNLFAGTDHGVFRSIDSGAT